ncbi:hypothetical protein PG985_007628, partial [Apiospora marii]|uniref:uncharacterized protein n=1 Tax=Apiospora marii TaxID=335849 RepID=UPI00312E1459
MSNSSQDIVLPALVTTRLVVVSAIFPIISLVSLYFRYRVRRSTHADLGPDDWCLSVSWLSSLGMSITVWVFSATAGINRYKAGIDPATTGAVQSLLCIWIASWFSQVALSTVKIAILFFYKRIFVKRYFQVVSWVVIALCGMWGILFLLLVLFGGDPISKVYTGVGRWRYDVEAVAIANVGTSIALDFLVLSLPLPVISKLRLATRKKVAVAFIFWLGIFEGSCCAAAIVRLVLMHRALGEVIDYGGNIAGQSTQFCFLIIEAHCSILAACLPCYGPLVAGIRVPDSVIRRIRSVIPVASRDSSPRKSRRPSGPTTPHGNRGESEVELQESPGKWVHMSHEFDTVVSSQNSGSVGGDDENGNRGQAGIKVTRGLDV